MTRTRNIVDVEKLDEERVALRVRVHILDQQGANQVELQTLRAQMVQLDRQIASMRATERRAYHSIPVPRTRSTPTR